MTQRNSAKGKKRRKKPEKLEFVQDFIPIKELRHGIIETTDGRYIKILEIEPINFMLRSDDEQFSIISTFASWLKISPMKLQFKSITRRADSDKHVAMVREELEAEPSEECKHLGEDYINLIKDVGSREALTRRFFLIFQYEEIRRNETDDFSQIYSMMQTAEQNARAYFMQCGNNILQPEDPDEATAEILYMFFNRRSCVNEPFSSRVERVVLDTMAAKNKVIGTGKPMQMRNFLLRGPAGTGKTMGAKAIAAGLNLPYMKYTCSAGTEIFDFVGMIFPDSDSSSTGDAQLDTENAVLKSMGGVNYANVSKLMNLPELDDMDYDPAGVYKALTGVEKPDACSQDCMAIVLDKVTEKVRALSKRDENAKSSGQTYTYVETDFIKALKNGYVIEIQEPSTIVQPGVLVGLNSLLEQTGSITLPTGEIIERHPDAVVVVTTNVSYEGCRGMNQSVIDRMSLVRDVEMPSPEVMVQRAMSVTGATDEFQVSQMVQVVNDLAEYCRKNSITDGSYGMRSLIDWIVSTEITGDAYNSAMYTIISKATSDELDREALISAVLEPIIPPKRRKATA